MIRINLLKPEAKDVRDVRPAGSPERAAKKPPAIGNLLLLLVIVGLAGWFYFQKKAIDEERELLEAAQAEKAKLQYVIARLNELETRKQTLQRQIGLINDLKSTQDLVVRIMDEVSRHLPEWVWLTETSYDTRTLQIKGKALSNNLIADYAGNLESSEQLSNVEIVSTAQRKSGNDVILEFSMNARIVRPQEEPPPAAKPAAKTGKRGTP
jgi:type IV pilus assembly protein PilN